MKRLLTSVLTLTLFLGYTSTAHAQQPTTQPTSAPTQAAEETDTPLDETIKSLKEKIEDKVDQINKSSKKVIKGFIASIQDGTLKLTTESEEEYTISLDETITSLFSSSPDGREAIEQTDLEKGNYIVVSGPLIEKQMSANTIYIQIPYVVLHGHITALDKSASTIDVVTFEKDEYTLDIEDETTQQIMNSKTLELEESGFSKYRVGDTVHFVIERPGGDAKTATAIRTLIIPQEYFVDEESTTPSVTEATP